MSSLVSNQKDSATTYTAPMSRLTGGWLFFLTLVLLQRINLSFFNLSSSDTILLRVTKIELARYLVSSKSEVSIVIFDQDKNRELKTNVQ